MVELVRFWPDQLLDGKSSKVLSPSFVMGVVPTWPLNSCLILAEAGVLASHELFSCFYYSV